MEKRVIIVGGGPAGLQTAAALAEAGVRSLIVEKESRPGGKLTGWYKLFPTFTPAEEVLRPLAAVVGSPLVELCTGVGATAVAGDGVTLEGGERIAGDAVVLCTGFDLFDARLKEEYGYGIYDDVITSADLERRFAQGRIVTAAGREPRRVAFLHCVGSRDEKVAQRHCSKVCCVTGVKQAMEVRKMLPSCEIYNFYMDIRMFGPGYEEMYRDAQLEAQVNFIRGRISEVSPTIDGRLQLKAEDTLVGRPLRMTVDLLVLLVGMHSAASNIGLAKTSGVRLGFSDFIAPQDRFGGAVRTGVPGLFVAGCATAPKNIGECLGEADSAAREVIAYLKAR